MPWAGKVRTEDARGGADEGRPRSTQHIMRSGDHRSGVAGSPGWARVWGSGADMWLTWKSVKRVVGELK